MAEKRCSHCSRPVRENDKYCIYCGKPVIVDIPEPVKEKERKKKSSIFPETKDDKEDSKKKKQIPFESGDKKPPADPIDIDEILEEDDKGKVPFTDDEEEFIPEDLNLPIEVRNQLEKKIELALLNFKKDIIKDKLKEIMDDVKSEKYEYDMDFAKEVNIKLDAIKEVQKEVQEKEEEIKNEIGIFKFDELNHIIEERRAQLTELKRKFKLNKIKTSIFEQLKREYATEYREAKNELAGLQKQVRIWISKLKTEKNREEIKLKTFEGRHFAREISKEELNEKKSMQKKVIDQLEQKLQVLKNFSGR